MRCIELYAADMEAMLYAVGGSKDPTGNVVRTHICIPTDSTGGKRLAELAEKTSLWRLACHLNNKQLAIFELQPAGRELLREWLSVMEDGPPPASQEPDYGLNN